MVGAIASWLSGIVEGDRSCVSSGVKCHRTINKFQFFHRKGQKHGNTTGSLRQWNQEAA